jgi:hypothetical protein
MASRLPSVCARLHVRFLADVAKRLLDQPVVVCRPVSVNREVGQNAMVLGDPPARCELVYEEGVEAVPTPPRVRMILSNGDKIMLLLHVQVKIMRDRAH